MVALSRTTTCSAMHAFAGAPVAAQLLDRADRRLLVPDAFLAPVRQQPVSSASAPTFLTLSIGSLTSFVDRPDAHPQGWLVSNAALLTYVIPASFLAIPFYRIMQTYGLANNLWSVIAAEVDLRHALRDFHLLSNTAPVDPDRARRSRRASTAPRRWQMYLRIYLPLMAPALVAVGTYALLLAWNEYLYQFLLLSCPENMTVPVALGKFLNSDEAPWNYMMATAMIYALPPIVIYYAFRRYMAAGLTMGGVKG